MNKVLFFLLSTMCLLLHGNEVSKYKFGKISPESGIAYNAITTILAAPNGFLWFGSENGLYLYDGISFHRYKHSYQDTLTIPSDIIYNIHQDSSKKMWVCTSKGVASFDKEKNLFIRLQISPFKNKKINNLLEVSPHRYILQVNGKLYLYNEKAQTYSCLQQVSSQVSFIKLISSGKFIIGTECGEVFIGTFIGEKIHINRIYQGTIDKITSICKDKDWLYVGFENSGIEVINDQGNIINKYNQYHLVKRGQIPSNKIREIISRENGEIWIGTYNGLCILKGEELITFNNENSTLPSNSIYRIYKDPHENIWIGTWSGGLCHFSSYNYTFGQKMTYPNTNKKIGVNSSFSFAGKSKVWIGSEETGLILFDYKEEKIIEHITNPLIHIKSLIQLKDKLWIGTVENGLYCKKENEKTFKPVFIDYFKTNKAIINHITHYENKLWIATRNFGIIEYNIDTKETVSYNTENKTISSNLIWQIYADSHGDIYACSDVGLYIKKRTEKTFKKNDIKSNETNKEYFYCICPINYNELLLGSKSNGIYVYNTKSRELKEIENNQIFKSINIYTINQDPNKLIWISTDNGILSYDPKNKQISLYSESDGVIGKQFHPIAGLITNDGTVFFGSTNGFNFIDTKNIIKNPFKPTPYPIEIKVNNKEVNFKNKEIESNSQFIPDINTLKLRYDQNTLSFRFANNNLLKSSNNKLRYKLEGYQRGWAEIPQTENIIFTQVPPGKYVLRILGSNNNGVWGEIEQRINISIAPPFYATRIAYVIYTLLLCCISFILYKMLHSKIKLKKEIEVEKYQNLVNKKATEERTKFFMNISNEIRTPLSLINSPLKELEEKYFDKDTNFHIETIRRNTDRLLFLTEQILDFRLLEVNKIQVNKKRIDIVGTCKDIVNNYIYYIQNKHIDFSFCSEASQILIYIDPEMITKIIHNLLSNAIKYTNEKAKVKIEIKKTILNDESYIDSFYIGKQFYGKSIEINISDNGIGIPTDKYELIFERFQTFHSNDQEGSGIGLHLCKEFIIKNDGHIMLKSSINNGSTFTIHLPFLGSYDEIINDKSTTIKLFEHQEDFTLLDIEEKEGIKANSKKQQNILIVNENKELIYYLKKSLSKKYNCFSLRNSQTVVSVCTETQPDIILMDIIMASEKDLECIKQIKSQLKIKHIPIILLSGAVDSKLQYQIISAGVDVFLVKPVNELLLMKHIEKLINQKDEKLQAIRDIIPSNFIERINYFIDKNIQNPNFDVNILAEEMNMSRSSLFRKIKNETNENISEYIKGRRLQKAVSLMKTKGNSIEEISYACGFSSSSYFGRCFKNKFGKSPKDFIQNNI